MFLSCAPSPALQYSLWDVMTRSTSCRVETIYPCRVSEWVIRKIRIIQRNKNLKAVFKNGTLPGPERLVAVLLLKSNKYVNFPQASSLLLWESQSHLTQPPPPHQGYVELSPISKGQRTCHEVGLYMPPVSAKKRIQKQNQNSPFHFTAQAIYK